MTEKIEATEEITSDEIDNLAEVITNAAKINKFSIKYHNTLQLAINILDHNYRLPRRAQVQYRSDNGVWTGFCSECNFEFDLGSSVVNYCPKCGALLAVEELSNARE